MRAVAHDAYGAMIVVQPSSTAERSRRSCAAGLFVLAAAYAIATGDSRRQRGWVTGRRVSAARAGWSSASPSQLHPANRCTDRFGRREATRTRVSQDVPCALSTTPAETGKDAIRDWQQKEQARDRSGVAGESSLAPWQRPGITAVGQVADIVPPEPANGRGWCTEGSHGKGEFRTGDARLAAAKAPGEQAARAGG